MTKLLPSIFLLLLSSFAFSQSLTFQVANPAITGTSPQFFEFDIQLSASTTGTFHSSGQIYFDYNTVAFGTFVATNGNVVFTHESLLNGIAVNSAAKYFSFGLNDNAANRTTITWFAFNSGIQTPWADYFNEVLTTPVSLFHVSLRIQDITQNAGVQFSNLTDGQIFYADSTNNPIYQQPYGTAPNFPYTYLNDFVSLNLSSIAFPVNWNGLAGTVEEEAILIEWQTLQEVNNEGFEIQRKGADGVFSPIAWIDGKGTTDLTSHYQFTDQDVHLGLDYVYRIRQVDVDGQYSFSPLVHVQMPYPTGFSSSVFPNPVTAGKSMLRVESAELEDLQVELYDNMGRKIWQHAWKPSAGTRRFPLYLNDVPSGSYQLLVMDQDGNREWLRISVQ